MKIKVLIENANSKVWFDFTGENEEEIRQKIANSLACNEKIIDEIVID